MVAGVVVAGVVVAGTGAEAGIITAALPAFVVAPHAPSDVFITPPSIYIHFGTEVPLS